MIDTKQMLEDFLKHLEEQSTEELMAKIERARKDSKKDSWMFDDPDVIRVVRCKNCKKYGDVWHCVCDWTPDPEWFCGDGEPK